MEPKLKGCPCCEGEGKYDKDAYLPLKARVICKECKLATDWVEVSLDYCAKEVAAKIWNKRAGETHSPELPEVE